jgi:hypothetical protein
MHRRPSDFSARIGIWRLLLEGSPEDLATMMVPAWAAGESLEAQQTGESSSRSWSGRWFTRS